MLEDQLTEGIKSTLIIQESRQEHFGVYNCTVSNPYGSDVVEITLKAQSKYHYTGAIYWLILSVTFILMLNWGTMNTYRVWISSTSTSDLSYFFKSHLQKKSIEKEDYRLNVHQNAGLSAVLVLVQHTDSGRVSGFCKYLGLNVLWNTVQESAHKLPGTDGPKFLPEPLRLWWGYFSENIFDFLPGKRQLSSSNEDWTSLSILWCGS